MHSVRKETNSIFMSLDLGSVDYIIKPVSFDALLKVIKRYV
jgi:response regulator of citrate/malate metabolism